VWRKAIDVDRFGGVYIGAVRDDRAGRRPFGGGPNLSRYASPSNDGDATKQLRLMCTCATTRARRTRRTRRRLAPAIGANLA